MSTSVHWIYLIDVLSKTRARIPLHAVRAWCNDSRLPHLVNELNRRHVHVVLGISFQHLRAVNGAGLDARVVCGRLW